MLLCRVLDVLEQFSVPDERMPAAVAAIVYTFPPLTLEGWPAKRQREPRSILAEIDDASGDEQERSAIALAVV